MKWLNIKLANTESQQTQHISTPSQKETAKFTLGNNNYILKGKEVSMDIAPFLDNNNRVMLPARFVANAMGVRDENISWNDAENAVTIKTGNQTVTFAVDQPNYFINRVSTPMDTKTVLKDGRVMVPFRILAQALGGEVTWDEAAKTASIIFTTTSK